MYCVFSLEVPRIDASNAYVQQMLNEKISKNIPELSVNTPA